MYHQSRVLVESNRLFFFREALRRLVSKRQGGSHPPAPLPGRIMENALQGRGLILMKIASDARLELPRATFWCYTFASRTISNDTFADPHRLTFKVDVEF